MVRLKEYAGLWEVVRYYTEEKGRLYVASDWSPHSHVMVERGRRVMILPRQEVG